MRSVVIGRRKLIRNDDLLAFIDEHSVCVYGCGSDRSEIVSASVRDRQKRTRLGDAVPSRACSGMLVVTNLREPWIQRRRERSVAGKGDRLGGFA